MKAKRNKFLVSVLITAIFNPAFIYAFAPITHICTAEDIIEKAKLGELPSDIAYAITTYPEHFKGGENDL